MSEAISPTQPKNWLASLADDQVQVLVPNAQLCASLFMIAHMQAVSQNTAAALYSMQS